jgi:hypothetical protein
MECNQKIVILNGENYDNPLVGGILFFTNPWLKKPTGTMVR